MALGNVGEFVTVTGASPVVDVQNVEQRQVMDTEVINSIPTGKGISGTACRSRDGRGRVVGDAARP